MSSVLDYFKLTSPRIILLVLLTGFTGMWIGSRGTPQPSCVLWGILGIGLASAGASVFNNYFDRDIDRIMRRTSKRPLPTGRISPQRALLFAVFLSLAASFVLIFLVNILSALLAVLTIFLYSYLYTVILKRKTPLATEIGGISGALPPVIGWAAVKGDIGFEALALFAIIFLWQPPHFWALASRYKADYKKAGIPTLPAVKTDKETKGRSIIYVMALMIISTLPYHVGIAGRLYLLISSALGIIYLLLYLSSLLSKRISNGYLFSYSIIYLSFIFILMAIDLKP